MPSEAEPRSPSRANADDASADVAEGAMARRRASLDGEVLVGGEGQDYIAATLSRADDVAAAMERVRKHGALLDADTEPVLGLLSALGVKRGEAYREMLERAVAELTRRAPTLPQGTLETYCGRGWCRLEVVAALCPKRFKSSGSSGRGRSPSASASTRTRSAPAAAPR